MREKLKIGITIGDVNGIGMEVILKSLYHEKIFDICTPVIYGNSKIVYYHRNIVDYEDMSVHNVHRVEEVEAGKINVVNVWQDNVNITLGKPTDSSGKYAFKSLEAAVADVKAGKIDAIVTAPINKQAMQMAGFQYIGHTEYLTEQSESDSSMMMMVSDSLIVGLVTAHIPLKDVARTITKENIMEHIHRLNSSMKKDFGKEKPLIGVLGLNPHAGDDGYIGKEDKEIIRPAIVEMKNKGMMVLGPYGADGFFGSSTYSKFDAVLAMYHDQGLIPFKALTFGEGVNYTAGLSFVRTSPDHGTAYNIVGGNKADHHSFLQAIFKAIDIVRNRREYAINHANPLQPQNP